MKALKEWFFFVMMVIMTTMLVIGCLTSCNPQKKIQKAERVLKDANALAKICADEFPIKETFVKGDSVVIFDTLYVGENVFDTLYETKNDTVTKFVVKTLPAKIITKTVRVTDTIIKENTARVADLTNVIKTKDIQIAVLEADRDNWKAKARQRFWWLLIAIGAIGAYVLLKVKKIISF